jgi:endonuclease III
MATTSPAKRHAAAIVRRLRKSYPRAECALEHTTPFQLLVATILSAQCTDERVNRVTPALFREYSDAASMAGAAQADLEKLIKSTGFFRAKAKNLLACSQQLVAKHRGEVPKDFEALVQLAGVGRKTANVVMGTAFRVPTGVVVDTHVSRISRRLGMTAQTSAERIEQDLIAQLPKKEWIDFSHRLIHHGRQVCKARKPLCELCSLNAICPRIGVSG